MIRLLHGRSLVPLLRDTQAQRSRDVRLPPAIAAMP
jgi:hypothetical protein